MKINIAPLLSKAGEETTVEAEQKYRFPEEEIKLASPVNINVTIVNTGDSILVRGKISGEVEFSCVRCLKVFLKKIEVPIEEIYRRGRGQEDLEGDEEEISFPIEEDNTIDLTEAIRQNLIVNMPVNPLCHEKCPGIKQEEK